MVSLNFLKKKNKVKTPVSNFLFSFLKIIFLFKFFWKKNIKFTLYLKFLGAVTAPERSIRRKNVIFILKKKKNAFILSILQDGKLTISTSLGSILRFLKVGGKSAKRSKKGFLVFLNTFKKLFTNYRQQLFMRNIFINFFDFYLLLFFKKLRFLFNSGNRLILNLNLKTQTKYFKKTRGIKRRITKNKIKMFLSDWKLIKAQAPLINKV